MIRDHQTSRAGGRRSRRSWFRRIIMPLAILLAAWAVMQWSSRQQRLLDREVGVQISALCEVAATLDEHDPAPELARRMHLSTGTLEVVRSAVAVAANDPAGGPPITVHVEPGDAEAPFGDGSATHRAYIRRGGENVLILRVRYADRGADPHVLGYIRPERN